MTAGQPPSSAEPAPSVLAPVATPTQEVRKNARRWRVSRRRLAAVAIIAVGVWYFAIYWREPSDDLGRFQGEWRLAIPLGANSDGRARLKPVIVRVTGDRWVYVADGKEMHRYTLVLRPDVNPKEIDLVMLGADDKPTAFVIRGVYTIDRDRAKVAHAPSPEPRPATLDETDPDSAGLWLLERAP
jgi:uncharacterized protein (TIGR03067 family)